MLGHTHSRTKVNPKNKNTLDKFRLVGSLGGIWFGLGLVSLGTLADWLLTGFLDNDSQQLSAMVKRKNEMDK